MEQPSAREGGAYNKWGPCNNNVLHLSVCSSMIRSSNTSTDSWHLEGLFAYPGSPKIALGPPAQLSAWGLSSTMSWNGLKLTAIDHSNLPLEVETFSTFQSSISVTSNRFCRIVVVQMGRRILGASYSAIFLHPFTVMCLCLQT